MVKKLSSQKAPKEDTITIAGREVTTAQIPHIRHDIKAARSILHKLNSTRTTISDTCYTSPVVKIIES
jgi:hypothetical protein